MLWSLRLSHSLLSSTHALYLFGPQVGANALTKGDIIEFDGPFDFSWPAMRKILEDANRFTAVSLPALKELGVSGVCWLGCCEVHSGAGDEAPDGKDWSSGAFVYIYDNPEYDCISL